MKKTILSLAVLLSLSACGRSNSDIAYQQPQYAPQQQMAPGAAPVIVQAAPQESGMGSMLMGGALGFMLGRHTGGGVGNSGGSGYHAGTTVNKTVINKTVIVQHATPAPTAPTATPAPAAAPKRFGTPGAYASAYATRPTPAAPSRSFGGSGYGASRSSSFSRGRR